MNHSAGIYAFLADQLADASVQWSLGTFGAIAEFMRDADEPIALGRTASSLSATTARGGVRIDLPADIRLHASETAVGANWSHRVALCLPAERCAMSRRTSLTELEPDGEALRDADRNAVLFDLGLGCLQVDACIRSCDAEVVAQLRQHVGRSVFERGNPAMSVILATHPHRVFVTRLGRMEVYQPIPPPDGKSPEGPHTHVLPKLLAHGRTHAATEPVPDGFVPCAHVYPLHAAKDGLGRALPFDAGRHAAFQDILRSFGDPSAVALKQRVLAAIAAGENPSALAIPDSRFARAGVRIALRQLRAAGAHPPALDAWTAAYDASTQTTEIDEATMEDLH